MTVVVNVDELRADLARSVRRERGRLGAGMTGLGAVLGGAWLAVGHTQPVAVAAGLLLMGAAWLAPYADRLRRPVRSGPPIHPASELAAVEATVHHRVAIESERVDGLNCSHDQMREELALQGKVLARILAATRSIVSEN
jgi:hypothetical protein